MLRELKNSMDDLWETPVKKRELHWFRTYISSRLVSLSVIPVFAVLLIVSLVFSTLLAFAGPSAEIWLKIGNMAFLALVTTSLFAFIFRYMPGRKIPWKEVLSGAFATAILFILGKSIIGLYLAHFAGTSAFGTAGAFVLILLWIYYSVQIFFFGASMTYVWSRNYGYLKTHK
jgi:membrane protein